MSNDLITPNGGAVGAVAGRLDVRGMFRHYLAPFKAVEPFRDLFETADQCRFATQRDTNDDLIALHPWHTPQQKGWAIRNALAILKAVAGRIDTVYEGINRLNIAMCPPDEEIIRAILGAMLSILRAKPTEGAELYVDALVGELTEPETGEPFCAPAIAAAAKEIWTTRTFPPSIPEFMGPAKKHQQRIELVRAELVFIAQSYDDAADVLEKLAPEKLPKIPEAGG